MNNQETFDIVAEHLMKQGERSVDVNGCAYRGMGDLKCAVGVLISDADYRHSMEGECPSNIRLLAGFDTNLLDLLQWLHDKNEPSYWREGLAMIAGKFNLKYESNKND